MHLTRREVLLAGLAAPLGWTEQSRAPTFDRGFARVSRIADGVYATIANPARGRQCLSNGGVIAGRHAVLIVEGHFDAVGAELELEVARTVSKAPVHGVVDTHYHLDHTFGNVGYARHGVPILAHEQVGPLMKARYEANRNQDRAAALAPWEQRLAAAAGPREKTQRAGDLEVMRWLVGAIHDASLAFPTVPLGAADLPKRIDLGGLTAILEFHRGHSPTDVIIRVPERDVVFTGDLFFNHAYPVVPDADILAWRRVVDEFLGYGRATRFIPGHGPLGRLEHVRAQAAIMDDLRAHAERMQHAGATVEEAERRYVVPRQFSDFDMLCWNFTVGGAMRTYFEALK